ncbi:MAG: tRNA (adenosine(37)-N6)-threonylcarbamoyltransferase complex ATPase subunit type 1 TsaE [Vampirovibrionales bacterium]|jgi:tRNA threonylcarbamoyladenosine biosynthesis protein TsaE|nr:tRNA (adenosine(37)-N6)-threonylcarbamoyltransferase complex ATPase subunit type 1 TsaE [Vampirovibrionales bacterium]
MYFEHSASELGLPKLCDALLHSSQTPLTVALDGDLGAGKTTLARHFAEALGIAERVTSPSFVLMNVYRHPQESLGKAGLIHADFYRLDDRSGACLMAELEELQAMRPAWVWVEWAKRIPSFADAVDIQLEIAVVENARCYQFTGVSTQGMLAVKALKERFA